MQTYDEVYGKPEFYWGLNPNQLCEEVIKLIPPEQARKMKVIDLGCGEGRDLIHFLKHGFQGTGVDISRPGLDKAQRWARDEGLLCQTVQASLLDFRLNEPYDVIYSSGTLTYLPPALRPEVFENYRRHTRVGGLNVFNVFLDKPFIAMPPDWGADEYFYRSGELLTYYWDWEVVSLSEFIFDCNSSGAPHRHAMDVLMVRRVSP